MNSGFRDEAHYRTVMKATLGRLEKAFDDVDPDVVECSVQFGALTLAFPGGSKCIVSSQPSVYQLWLAIAAKGVAFHFDYDHARGLWRDDKGGSIELFDYLSRFLKEATGEEIRL